MEDFWLTWHSLVGRKTCCKTRNLRGNIFIPSYRGKGMFVNVHPPVAAIFPLPSLIVLYKVVCKENNHSQKDSRKKIFRIRESVQLQSTFWMGQVAKAWGYWNESYSFIIARSFLARFPVVVIPLPCIVPRIIFLSLIQYQNMTKIPSYGLRLILQYICNNSTACQYFQTKNEEQR